MFSLHQIINNRRVIGVNKNSKGYQYTVECLACGHTSKGVQAQLRRIHCACERRAYSIGARLGKLTIIGTGRRQRKAGREVWGYKVKCDCGKLGFRPTSDLIGKKCKIDRLSCGCIRIGHTSKRWTGVGEMPGSYYCAIKAGAKVRSIKFSITKEYIYKLYRRQGKRCAITGEPIVFTRTRKGWNGASLDRIDSTKGYVKGNVQWVLPSVNIIKMDYSMEEFIRTCKLVVKHQKQKDKQRRKK